MQARSALFDVYGDHLRSRGGSAPVAALVRLLAPLGVAAPAARTAVSRMVREGWLEPVRLPEGPGYALTARAAQRLDDASVRIYRTRVSSWDGWWHLLVIDVSGQEGRPGYGGLSRGARDRLRAELGFLGYAPLAGGNGWPSTWIASQHSGEVDEVLASCGARAERFRAESGDDPAALVERTWDLDELAKSYQAWLADARELLGMNDEPVRSADMSDMSDLSDLSDMDAYARRSLLVHGWRKFLFHDPGLPRELLPESWPGDEAAAFFDTEAERLRPAANRFVDHCLQEGAT